ncbi:RNA polymerase II transcription factor SIII subunit A-domain-containing protein, partial [Rhexocercosporidium sp. MPI-PUGE-AT-0058]
MPAPSLVDSCTKACIKNIRSLIDVGSFEYWQIRTVLQRVESPEQLHQIELNSPQLLGEDAELWQSFISRHIPNWRSKNYRPKNPKKWYEVYCKYKKEQQEEIARDEEILRTSMMGLKAARETNVSKIVDLKMLPKLPRDPRMIANNGGVPLKGKGFRKEGPSTLNWTSGSKTKMTDGKSVLTRARREAKEISQMGKLAKPTHRLSGPLGQVRRAPEGMVKEYKTAAQPAIKILSRRHQASNTGGNITGSVTGPSLEERERRLKAAMAGGSGSKRDAAAGVKHTMVGSSDDDLDNFIDDDDEGDDLFDEAPKYKARPVSSSTSSRPPPPRPATSRPYQQSSSPPAPSARPKPKPSDVISSLLSKPRPGSASSPPPV